MMTPFAMLETPEAVETLDPLDPTGQLRRTAEAALHGDPEAAAWLRIMAPDLAEDERRLRAWIEWQQREDARRAALLDPAEPLDAAWELAGQLDHYVETIHERATNP